MISLTDTVIPVKEEIIKAATEKLSRTNSRYSDILRSIGTAHDETAERFIRYGELSKRDFYKLLKSICDLHTHAPPAAAIGSARTSKAISNFFEFVDKDKKTGDDSYVDPGSPNEAWSFVKMTDLSAKICEAFSKGTDKVILANDEDKMGSSYWVIARDKQSPLGFDLTSLKEDFWSVVLSGPNGWVYRDNQNPTDIVTNIIINHHIKINLRQGSLANLVPVEYRSDVLQVRSLQRFPKIREGCGDVKSEILVDGQNIEQLRQTTLGLPEENTHSSINNLQPGKVYNYVSRFTGHYPVFSKTIDGISYHMACVDHFLAAQGTKIEVLCRNSAVSNSLEFAVVRFEGFARTTYSFLSQVNIRREKIAQYKHRDFKARDQSLITESEENRDGQQIDFIFKLTPVLGESFESKQAAAQRVLNSRVDHEFLFLKYEIGKNSPTGFKPSDKCCRLNGLACETCFKSIGFF